MIPRSESRQSNSNMATAAWAVVAVVLVAFAIPWFAWRSSAVVAGLPVWLWWHVGWMGLASLVFWQFARDAWGIGVEEVESRG